MLKLTDPAPAIIENELVNYRIGSMEVFRLDCKLFENRIPWIGSECNCGLLKISSSGISGWGEYVLPCSKENFDIIHWASVFAKLKGLTIDDAMHYVQNSNDDWGQVRKGLVEAALLDLAFKLRYPFIRQKDVASSLGQSYLIDHSQMYYSF